MRKGISWSCAVLMRARTSSESRSRRSPAGMQKLAADPVVETDAARDLVYVGADLLAKISDFINEGDFSRQEGIGGVFDEFSSASVSVQNGCLVETERTINLINHPPGALVIRTDNNAVGMFKIVDGCTFTQKLRIRYHHSIGARASLGYDALNSSAVPTGTVDLVMTTVKPLSAAAISRAAW